MKICQHYGHQSRVSPTFSAHTTESFTQDLKKVVGELATQVEVFQYKEGRRHSNFKNMKGSILSKLDKLEVIKWMQEQLDKLT